MHVPSSLSKLYALLYLGTWMKTTAQIIPLFYVWQLWVGKKANRLESSHYIVNSIEIRIIFLKLCLFINASEVEAKGSGDKDAAH